MNNGHLIHTFLLDNSNSYDMRIKKISSKSSKVQKVELTFE
jgi:hypothetical protein